jgi:hypothetical protein
LWDTGSDHLTLWETNEKKTVEAINLLLVVIYRESIAGTKHQQLRDVIGPTITPSRRSAIQTNLKVHLLA